MKTILNQQQLSVLLEDFYHVSHIPVCYFDTNGVAVPLQQPNLNGYCKTINNNRLGREACKKCDQQACMQAALTKRPYIYRCHAGLTEVVVPIVGYDRVIGYLMIGQFRLEGTKESSDSFLDRWEEWGLDKEYMTACFDDLLSLNMKTLKAYSRILQTYASYAWTEDYIRVLEEPLGKLVERYLLQHFARKLTLQHLIDEFQVGRSTLCKEIKKETGMTFLEVLCSIRIKEAKKLLENSTMSIAEIACAVGVEDYNYFTKVFKQKTGLTPSAYRKTWQT